MSTVQQLPPEILSYIFLSCDTDFIPEYAWLGSKIHYCRPNPSKAPLLVSQVCSHWRNVALSTGELWSSFFLECKRNKNSDYTTRLCLTWLGRSQNQPLSLSITWDNIQGFSDNDAETMVAAILPFSDRWKHLNIGCVMEVFMDKMGQQRFPLLKTLALYDEPISLDDRTVSLDSLQMPSLARLHLRDQVWSLPDVSHLPPNTMTHIYLTTPMKQEEVLGYLQHLPSLVDLKVLIDSNTDTNTRDQQPVVHARLYQLQLRGDGRYMETLLGALTLPSLVVLALVDDELVHPFSLSAISNLLGRSSPGALRKLEVRGLKMVNASESELIRLLSFTPQLVSLIIWHRDPLNAFGSELGKKMSRMELVPHLTTFFVRSLSTMDDQVVLELLKSRPGFKRVHFIHPSASQELRTFLSENRWIGIREI